MNYLLMLMEIRSISDLDKFSLFIFDLDNTLYNERDYLFGAYSKIAADISSLYPSLSEDDLSENLKNIFLTEGRTNLFDKFLEMNNLEGELLDDCLNVLRNYKAEKNIALNPRMREFLIYLRDKGKTLFVLTNGNPVQQRNKIRSINWNGLDENIEFIFADELEPKPSPEGLFYILKNTRTGKDDAIFIGDRDSDRECAANGGITFLGINDLNDILKSS
ncbi:MAG TPA: HAD-IA family hydrolase [Bacteroidales bacterium]|nr:HAD-IA family hydrolase [Bacteroidales bacterium]HRW84568.1 HAD-IA family hydrolase [Bacteroidales bacterium]